MCKLNSGTAELENCPLANYSMVKKKAASVVVDCIGGGGLETNTMC